MSDNQKSPDYAGILDGTAPAEEYTATPEEEEVVSRFHKLFDTAKETREPFARIWAYNRNMLEGNQLLYQDTTTHEYVKVSSSKAAGRLFSVNNKIQPAGRSLHGKLCRAQPHFSSEPESTDQTEMHGATVAEAFIRRFDNKHQMDVLYSVMKFQDVYAGNSCIQLAWDPMGGRTLASCATCDYVSEDEDLVGAPCPDCTDLAQQAMQMAGEADAINQSMGLPPEGIETPEVPNLAAVKEGEEKPIVHRIENVFPDPSCTDIRDARYIIIKHNLPLSEARRLFPEKGVYLQAQTSGAYVDDIAYQTYNYDAQSWSSSMIDDNVTVYEYHERGTDAHPDGRVIFFGCRMILDEREGMYKDFGRLPFFFNHWWKYPTRLWAQSPIENITARQRELNELETAMREHMELVSRARVLAPIGSMSPDDWNNRSGSVVFWNPNTGGGKPTIEAPPNMPQSVYERRDALVNDINEGHTITAAEVGAMTDSSGRAMAILEAEGDQQIAGILKYNISELQAFYRCMLIMVKQRYRPDRKFLIMGDNGAEVYSFEDLKFGAAGPNITLALDDGLSSNRAVRQNEVANWVQLGAFTDPETGVLDRYGMVKAAGLKFLGQDKKASETAAAQMYLKRIEAGDFSIQPQIEDDAKIFSETYLEWIRSKGRLPDTKAETVDFVRKLYMYYIQQIMLVQAQTQAAAEGAGSIGSGSEGQMSAPGGTPNGVSLQQGQASGASITGQAASTIKGADAAGEAAVRAGAHES